MNKSYQVRVAEKRLRQIIRLLERGATERVDLLLAGPTPDDGTWPNNSGMRYILARLEEEGVSGDENGVAALNGFSELASRHDDFLGEALIGRARILARIDSEGYLDEIISLCQEAIEFECSPKAMMILGSVLENERQDYDLAYRWYLRAYLHGSPWGLRWYAKSQAKKGRFIRSRLAHIATTISSPLMVAWYGSTGPYK